MKALITLLLLAISLSLGCTKLPQIIKEIRKAQLYLVIKSRSTSWGKPWVPD